MQSDTACSPQYLAAHVAAGLVQEIFEPARHKAKGALFTLKEGVEPPVMLQKEPSDAV